MNEATFEEHSGLLCTSSSRDSDFGSIFFSDWRKPSVRLGKNKKPAPFCKLFACSREGVRRSEKCGRPVLHAPESAVRQPWVWFHALWGKKRAKTRVCLFLFFFFLLTVRCFDQWGGRQSGWWVQGRREGDRDREGGDEVRWGGRGISAQRQRYGASETHGPKKEQEQEVPVAGESVKKRTSPLQWRCPSRRGNQDPRGRRRRARMRVRSWRRVPAAAGRNARSRLVLLCLSVRLSLCLYLHVCVRAWYDSCSKRFESLQRLDRTQQTEWSFSSIHVE